MKDRSSGTFDFGGIAVSLTSSSRRFRTLCRERYGAFAIEAEPVWRIAYRVSDDREPPPEFLYRARCHPLRSRREGTRLRITAPTFGMEIDIERRSGVISGPLASYPLDRLIQILWYETRQHGLMIHAAALADGDRGWICSGPSGSGKSTLAGLFPERALCDEFVAVSLDGSRPRLEALPFWQSRRGGTALEGLYLLRHGRRDLRRRLAVAEAFRRLRPEVVWPTFDGPALGRTFESLCELVDAVPIWELTFRPRRDVWRVISRPAGESREAA